MYVTSKENLSLNEVNDEMFAKLWHPTSCWTGSLSGAVGCGIQPLHKLRYLCIVIVGTFPVNLDHTTDV